MTCPTCLRPQATDEDIIKWNTDNEYDPDGDLCWKEYGGKCDPPDWFAAVTPLEVQDLRTMIAETRAALDDPDRHPDHPVGALALELREARAEVRRLRAQVVNEEARSEAYLARLAELTNGQPDPLIMAAATTTARLRATIAEMTPRWRTGEPPAGSWVWREGEHLPCRTLTDAEHQSGGDPDRLLYRPAGTVIPYPWGTARWCQINKPEKP